MLKYTTTQIVFAEIPDEVALAIEISNCPIHCSACHSKHLWNDVGNVLDIDTLDKLIIKNLGITCVCFMGGDSDITELLNLAGYIKTVFPDLSIAWYTGQETIDLNDFTTFDYIKVGPYIEERGPLNDPNTNQRLYQFIKETGWEDITYKFWK